MLSPTPYSPRAGGSRNSGSLSGSNIELPSGGTIDISESMNASFSNRADYTDRVDDTDRVEDDDDVDVASQSSLTAEYSRRSGGSGSKNSKSNRSGSASGSSKPQSIRFKGILKNGRRSSAAQSMNSTIDTTQSSGMTGLWDR